MEETNGIKHDGKQFVIIRTYGAGVHMGYITKELYTPAGIVVELVNSRRIWQWSGAQSLSQLAHSGSKKPEECNISLPVDVIRLVAIEIIYCTDVARVNLTAIKDWKI